MSALVPPLPFVQHITKLLPPPSSGSSIISTSSTETDVSVLASVSAPASAPASAKKRRPFSSPPTSPMPLPQARPQFPSPSSTPSSSKKSPPPAKKKPLLPSVKISTSTYDANAPSEDRSASIANVILSSPTSSYHVNLFVVLDGHGGFTVAQFASLNLLPSILLSLSESLGSDIVDKGVLTVNADVVYPLPKQQQLQQEDIFGSSEGAFSPLSSNGSSRSRRKKGKEEKNVKLHFLYDTASTTSSPTTSANPPNDFPDSVTSDENSPPSPTSPSQTTTPTPSLSPSELPQVSAAIKSAFETLDDNYMKTIPPTKVQKHCEPGGDWNAGSCANVAIVIQKVQLQTQKQNQEQNLDKVTVTPSQKHKYSPMLITAHVGDCRAVIGSSVKQFSSQSIAIPHMSQEVEVESLLSEEEEESDNDNDNDNDNDKDNDDTASEDTNIAIPNPNPLPHNDHKRKRSASPPPTPRLPLTAIELTADHNCYNQSEISIVQARCPTDQKAVTNPSMKGGIRRVAGSLAVTRALGDLYLKKREFSFHPYKEHVPYITVTPEVNFRELKFDSDTSELVDSVMVLASDGVFEHASNTQVIDWAEFQRNSLKKNGKEESNGDGGDRDCDFMFSNETDVCESDPAKQIVEGVMNHISDLRNKSRKTLANLPRGRQRRTKHDDITCMVVDLNSTLLN